jgi:transposase, IS5 family
VERLRPFYPKGERGRPPTGLERMLRIYFVQQWYGLADEAIEDVLYDSQALRGFAGIDLTVEAVPDATTVLHFRHWLERHELTRVLFDEVGAMLEERGLLMRQGTIVDATIIAAPSVSWNIAIKRSIIKALPKRLRDVAEPVERALAQVRAWVEHPFHVVKNRFGHKKLRYRGLANTAQLHTLFALANLVIVKKTLLAQPPA